MDRESRRNSSAAHRSAAMQPHPSQAAAKPAQTRFRKSASCLCRRTASLFCNAASSCRLALAFTSILRRVGFLVVSFVTCRRRQHDRATRRALHAQLVSLRLHMAAFNARFKQRGEVHSFARHIGKHNRFFAARMPGSGNVLRRLSREQQAIATFCLNGFNQRTIHPDRRVQRAGLAGGYAAAQLPGRELRQRPCAQTPRLQPCSACA